MARQTRPTPIWSILLCSAAIVVASPALAQVEVDDDRTTSVETATAADDGTASDVTITSTGTVTLTTAGPAATLNSDNALINNGSITINDVDGATGVSLEGGSDRSYTQTGSISILEDFSQADTDDDLFTDTTFASGTGRTGILISGASPFQGDVTLADTATVLIEGNESFGIDLSNTPLGAGLDGDLTMGGRMTIAGDNSSAVRLGSAITGNLTSNGQIQVQGTNSGAFDIGGDIGGTFTHTGLISNNGYRFPTRAVFNPDAVADRSDFGAEDLRQAASAITVNANIARGINLTTRTSTTEVDGEDVEFTVSTSNIAHSSSTPAILIDGDGTPIMIGTVSEITDPAADGFDADSLFAFINLGTINATGLYDDFDSSALTIADATIEGGIRNAGSIQVQTYVGAIERPIDGVELGTGLARVIVLGDNAVADRLNNSGLIIARATEATDEVYFDADNIPVPRPVVATAIDISATAQMTSIENEGTLSAVIVGRNGTATVVSDASGTLSDIINRGNISAVGTNSDTDGLQETDFTLVAFDLSNNTTGITFLQEALTDDDLDDDVTPSDPFVVGDIILGSGNDSFTSTAGVIVGALDFGGGDDALSLTDTLYSGIITNEDGLDITAVNSTLIVSSDGPIDITSASFDADSSFSPLIDGESGRAATLQATGAISFASGAQIAPVFSRIINTDVINGATPMFTVASASDLTVGDLASLNERDDGSFLFNTSYSIENNDLFITVDLRDSTELGLDTAQIGLNQSAFGATLQALEANSDLGNQVANLGTASEFYAAYNQLLPEFSAAARQFVLANSDSATGAVGNHLDAARRSQDKPGGAWLQEFAYFADRELAGLSEQYRGEGFGFTGGLDTELGPFHAVGVNFGFASTEIEDVIGVDEPLGVTTLMAGVYAGLASGALGIDAYFGGGYNQFEQNRRVSIGSFLGQSTGDWDGTHVTSSLRAGYDIDFGKRYWARPVVSVDYLRLSENAFTETGDVGVALSIAKRTSDVGAVTGLFNFGAEFNGARTWIRPSIRVGYRSEFLSDPVLTEYMFSGITNAAMAQTVSSEFPSEGMLIGFSLAAGSGFSSVGFDFDSDIRDGFIRHTGRIVVRLLF